jgi:hypothetical protein
VENGGIVEGARRVNDLRECVLFGIVARDGDAIMYGVEGYVRIDAKRRIGTEKESDSASRVEMDFQGLMRTVES